MEQSREIRLIPFGQRLPPAEIRRIAFPLARRIGARVVAINEPGVTPNFHAVVLDESQFGSQTPPAYLLYAGEYDAWAVASPREGQSEPRDGEFHLYRPRFLDHDAIMAAMAELHGIQLWTSYELSMPVPADFPEPVRGDLNYWRPDRLGDALFNWWD